jgi:hypothetical protein
MTKIAGDYLDDWTARPPWRSNRDFVADTREAVAALMADRRAKVRELKLRYFG